MQKIYSVILISVLVTCLIHIIFFFFIVGIYVKRWSFCEVRHLALLKHKQRNCCRHCRSWCCLKSLLLSLFCFRLETMSVFTLIGDSNVKRHMSPLSCREPHMAKAEVNICGRIEAVREVMRSTRAETTIVLVACLTNFVTSADDSSSSSVARLKI